MGAESRRRTPLVTNFDNAFVSGSKVKYGHTNPLLSELEHKRERESSVVNELLFSLSWRNGTDPAH